MEPKLLALPQAILPSEGEASQTRLQQRGFLSRLLHEPVLHFLMAGALIFTVYERAHPAFIRAEPATQIVLTKDDVLQLAIHWLAQGRTIPTMEQMRALIEQRVNEEVLSREALVLGLDKNDEVIKRRLAQKMDFLAADMAALQEPGASELKTWFAQNADLFARPPQASFRHLYFSADKPSAHDRAVAALANIAGKPADAAEQAAAADPFMFQDYYAERTPEQIAKEFGLDFTRALFQLKSETWQGPVKSGYGWHLVFVLTIEPRRLPAFGEVESEVKSAWLEEKQRDIKRAALQNMRARYTIAVPALDTLDFGSLRNSKGLIVPPEVLPQ